MSMIIFKGGNEIWWRGGEEVNLFSPYFFWQCSLFPNSGIFIFCISPLQCVFTCNTTRYRKLLVKNTNNGVKNHTSPNHTSDISSTFAFLKNTDYARL